MRVHWRRRVAASRRRGDAERGAALVEAALISPLVLMILFGIIEFGLLFRDSLTVTNGTRAAVRVAAAHPRQGNYPTLTKQALENQLSPLGDQSPQQMVIYKADPDTGLPFGVTSEGDIWDDCTSCIRYTWDGDSESFVYDSGTWPVEGVGSQVACAPTEEHPDGMFDFVGVYVEAWHKVLTPSLPPFSFLVNQGSEHRRVSAHAVMRLEPVGSNLFCGYVFP